MQPDRSKADRGGFRRAFARKGAHRHHLDASRLRARLLAALTALLIGAGTLVASSSAIAAPAVAAIEVQSLDGSGNNLAHPEWGLAGTPYSRIAPADYADGRSQMVTGPNSRYVSNRVFNDVHTNVFSERGLTQWGWTWGQFLDHTFGLREGRSPGDPAGEDANIPFNTNDPLEEFSNTLGVIPFSRSTPAPGTGVTNPREQINTISSYIDAFAVYGGTPERLEWLRAGPVDGNMANNSAMLLLPGQYLPRVDARGNASTAPAMEIDGPLRADPSQARVAGDIRANENIALNATQTLFAREHNRIVALLPSTLSEEEKFQIARRVVIAEQQYITYNEWLPAVGVRLPAYGGYNANVDPTLGNEFATAGFRLHSMIHGEIEVETDASRYTQAELDAFADAGFTVEVADGEVAIAIPQNIGFFDPQIVQDIELGPMLQALGLEPQYNNEMMLDNQIRSVLFQIPVSGNPECLDGAGLPECYDVVVDLGAIDVERGRDHGMPTYNRLRQALGLPAKTSFTALTGESTDAFPSGTGVDDPSSLEFTALFDVDNRSVPLDNEEATGFQRRSTTAARLRALFGSVNSVDAFTGIVSEPHVGGSEFGETQLALMRRQFTALRDGDRFFYGNDPGLTSILTQYGVDFRRTLFDVIVDNTDLEPAELNRNVFFAAGTEPVACSVRYTVDGSWPGGFNGGVRITNNGADRIAAWNLSWTFADGQRVSDLWNGIALQGRGDTNVTNEHWNRNIPGNGGSVTFGFTSTWNNAANARPVSFVLNGTTCAVT